MLWQCSNVRRTIFASTLHLYVRSTYERNARASRNDTSPKIFHDVNMAKTPQQLLGYSRPSKPPWPHPAILLPTPTNERAILISMKQSKSDELTWIIISAQAGDRQSQLTHLQNNDLEISSKSDDVCGYPVLQRRWLMTDLDQRVRRQTKIQKNLSENEVSTPAAKIFFLRFPMFHSHRPSITTHLQ